MIHISCIHNCNKNSATHTTHTHTHTHTGVQVGLRAAVSTGAVCFGGGMMVGGLGVATHNLPLLQLGYGALAGTGVGLSYTPPIQALMQWFPDKKGLAMGTLVAGFGGGSLVFIPAVSALMKNFSEMPTYLGTMDSVKTTTENGVLYAQVPRASTTYHSHTPRYVVMSLFRFQRTIHTHTSLCRHVAISFFQRRHAYSDKVEKKISKL